jgi:hypothetical protein
MVFKQEEYIGDSKLSSVNAPIGTPNAHVSKRDNVVGRFEGIL